MARHERAAYRGRDLRWWPLLLLLLAVVLLPTACLLWMMSRAIDNERAAVRQVLAEACRGHLVHVQKKWGEQWERELAFVDGLAKEESAQRCFFVSVVCRHLADSVVVADKDHRPVYPTLSPPQVGQPAESPEWTRAVELESAAIDQKAKLLAAAEAYAALAKSADANVAARALQAQARCLAKAGRNGEAIELLTDPLTDERFDRAVDGAGRLIVADADLRALELIGNQWSSPFPQIAERLSHIVERYGDSPLSSPQRIFLMKRLLQLRGPVVNTLWTLRAEELAVEFLESGEPLASKPVLQPSGIPGVWQLPSASGRVVALLREGTIELRLRQLSERENLPVGVRVELLPAGQTADLSEYLHVLPAGDQFPGWQLGLNWNDEQVIKAVAHGKIASYMLSGLLAVATASGLAMWIALRFLRQMRLTRLKNDLVATVSHELKTPLASIRLLVDTLLAADPAGLRQDARGTEEVVGERFPDSKILDRQPPPSPLGGQVREYLELIAKENTRLSRLIDNFLTFSRMERNKRAFSLGHVEPAAIVASAVDAVRERFEQSGCRFDVVVEPDLPSITADADALTTSLVNLLDNAWKYTESDKHITLRAYEKKWGQAPRRMPFLRGVRESARSQSPFLHGVCFAVSDNGIGLSRAACKRVFERFYQVDRELSRSRGGCGLGLSIVEFIVEGHGGRVTVSSRPGQGSTFTIVLPRANGE